MKRVKRIYLLFLVGLIFGASSCKKGPSWDTQILAPLVKTTLSMSNIITNATAVNNPADSSVTLVYRDSLYGLSLDSLFHLPDTTLVDSVSSGPAKISISPGGSILFGTPNPTTQISAGGANLVSAIVRSGYLTIKVTTNIPRITDYTYEIPSATKSGAPLKITLKVPAAPPSGTADTVVRVSLLGYDIDFTGPLHNSTNTVITNETGILDSSQPAFTTSNSFVSIRATFDSVVPTYAQGYFGTRTKIIGPQKTAFPLFNQVTAGVLDLQNVNVTFTLENGIGVDARVIIPQLQSINGRTGVTKNLSASFINNAININRATISGGMVNPSTQSFTLNNVNSNIVSWIDNLPTAINYQLQVTTDPPPIGNAGNSDFAFYGYGINAYFDISVPLVLAASNLTLEDTLPVSFANSTQAQQVKSGTFTLYASNLFPFSAGMQIYLLDNNMHVSDSIINPFQAIKAGVPNTNGFVSTPTNSTVVLQLNAMQANRLLTAKNIIVKAIFNIGCTTCGPGYNKIYDTYQLNLKLVGNFDYLEKS